MQTVAVGVFGATPELMEIAKPVPQAGQVLVKLQASGLNPFDWRLGDGILKDKLPHSFPLVLGVDGAGVIEATGPDVRRFQAGDQGVGQFLFVRVGEGSFADYAVINEDAVLSLYPHTLAVTSAAVLPTSGITALQLCQSLDLPLGSTGVGGGGDARLSRDDCRSLDRRTLSGGNQWSRRFAQ